MNDFGRASAALLARDDRAHVSRTHGVCNAASQIRDPGRHFRLVPIDPGSAAQHFMVHGVRRTRSVAASPQPTFFSGAGADFAQ